MNFLDMLDTNTALFYYIYGFAGQSRLADVIMVFLTTYGAYATVIGVGLYIAVYLPLRTGDTRERLRRFGRGVELLTTFFVVGFVTWNAKLLVAHPRPFETLADVIPLVTETAEQSFPSAHAAFTMALAVFVYIHYRRTLGVLLVVFASIVGISRLYVGVHYPADVAVGFLIGIGVALVLHRVGTIGVVRTEKRVVK